MNDLAIRQAGPDDIPEILRQGRASRDAPQDDKR